MKPDIALLDDANAVVFIGDAKWKLLNAEEAKLGVSQAHLYQMQAYANRYGVTELAIYYPMQRDLQQECRLRIEGLNACWITIKPVDILGSKLGGNSFLDCLSQEAFEADKFL